MASETIQLTAEGETATRTTIETRGFDIVVDEPPELGGEDTGPTPLEYLFAAWAGCMNSVCHLVAMENGVEIDGILFDVAGDIDSEVHLQDKSTGRAGVEGLSVDITVESETDEATIQQIVDEAYNRCPVTDNILNPTPVDTSVSVQPQTIT